MIFNKSLCPNCPCCTMSMIGCVTFKSDTTSFTAWHTFSENLIRNKTAPRFICWFRRYINSLSAYLAFFLTLLLFTSLLTWRNSLNSSKNRSQSNDSMALNGLNCAYVPLRNYSLTPMGIWTPYNTWLIVSIRVFTPNGISICSAGLTDMTTTQTNKLTMLWRVWQ